MKLIVIDVFGDSNNGVVYIFFCVLIYIVFVMIFFNFIYYYLEVMGFN